MTSMFQSCNLILILIKKVVFSHLLCVIHFSFLIALDLRVPLLVERVLLLIVAQFLHRLCLRLRRLKSPWESPSLR
jgi:hypothetical protein